MPSFDLRQTWKCTSCGSLNQSDRNSNPCKHCHILECDTNLKRAKELYILGNISTPSVSLIPLKIPFFIYPLSPPIINYSIAYQEKETLIKFRVELWDNRCIENYHIEYIQIYSYWNGIKSSTIINNKTPYYNIFSFHTKQCQPGFISFEIYAKCHGSTRISPKQSLEISLSPPTTFSIKRKSEIIILSDDDNDNVAPSNNNNNNNINDSVIDLTSEIDDDDKQNSDDNDKDEFVSHISYQQAMRLEIGDKIDIRGWNGKMYKAEICKIEIIYNQKTTMIETLINIKYSRFNSKHDEWIDIDDLDKPQLYRLAKYGSISSRRKHRLKYLKIGDFIDVNPIYIDPGWKPAEITKMSVLSGQIEVKFNYSIIKDRIIRYWIHLDNTNECDEFGKGEMDISQVETLFFATVSMGKYKIISIEDISDKNKVNVYESILRGKEKEKYEIEKYLWHGTGRGNFNALQSILKNGFDRSYNKVGRFGKGTYFAKNASYSVNGRFCGKDINDNTYYILLCRVIIGDYIEGKEDMIRIPTKEDGTEYDSLVNNKKHPQIFVSWRDYHAIPYYLIKFKSICNI